METEILRAYVGVIHAGVEPLRAKADRESIGVAQQVAHPSERTSRATHRQPETSFRASSTQEPYTAIGSSQLDGGFS